jgi:hypothetical protein
MTDILNAVLNSTRVKSETVTVRLPVDMIQALEKICDDPRVDLNRNNLIKVLIEPSLKELQIRLLSDAPPAPKAESNGEVRNRAAQILYSKDDLSADQNSAFNKMVGAALGFTELDGRRWTPEQKEEAVAYYQDNVEKVKAGIAELMKQNRRAALAKKKAQ